MMAATHRLGGLAAGVAAAAVLHTEPLGSGMVIAGAVLGSLFPDIDNRNSSISRKWRVLSLAVTVGQAVIRGMSNLFPARQKKYIRSLLGHRGITHSLIPVVSLPLIMVLVGYSIGYVAEGAYAAFGLAAGILSHLLFDMLAGGVPLFMPFSVKRVTVANIKTGGGIEWLFRAVLIIIFAYFGREAIPWQKLLQV